MLSNVRSLSSAVVTRVEIPRPPKTRVPLREMVTSCTSSLGIFSVMPFGVRTASEARHAALTWKTARWLVSAFPTLRFEAPSLWQDAASDVPAALRGELFEPVARAAGGFA